MIAIAPSHKSQLKNYTSWLEKLEVPYRVLQPGDVVYDKCSMLILTGGPDMGKESSRDNNDIEWFKQSYGRIPVLGICRGLQLANVVLGGILHEDLPDLPVKHTSNKKEISGEPNPLLESSYHEIEYCGRKIKVNSRHHQGIKILADGLTPIGFCEDGLIEANTGDNSLFVQWHPERPEVWGTEAEKIVSDWIKEKVKDRVDFQRRALLELERYYVQKGFSVVSEERIMKSINENYTSDFLHQLVLRFPESVKHVTDKKGKTAIKFLRSL